MLRRAVARIAIAAVLFTQLAVAAYACPELLGTAPGMVANGQAAAMPAGCEMPVSHNPNLCRHHCQVGNQSLPADAYVSADAPMVIAAILTVVEPLQPAAALELANLPVLRERETGPPPLIRFHVLRI